MALKIATSADGKIAYPEPNLAVARQREGGWITGDAARTEVHRLRSEFDAVLTGIGTVLADDPLLTCRIEGLKHKSPVRVVLDRKHRLPKNSKLLQSKHDVPLWVLDCETIEDTLKILAEKGITRLLVEAGQALNSAFIASGMVDRLYWFKAPLAIKDGLLAFSDHEKAAKQLANWNKLGYAEFPPDTLEILEPCSPAS